MRSQAKVGEELGKKLVTNVELYHDKIQKDTIINYHLNTLTNTKTIMLKWLIHIRILILSYKTI